MFAMKVYIEVVQMVIIRKSWKIRAVPVISQALRGCQCYCMCARYLSWSYRQHYQCMFIVDQTVLPNDQPGHVSQCFSREPGICVCGLQSWPIRFAGGKRINCSSLAMIRCDPLTGIGSDQPKTRGEWRGSAQLKQ